MADETFLSDTFSASNSHAPVFTIALAEEPPFAPSSDVPRYGEPARVKWAENAIFVEHETFLSITRPQARMTTLFRHDDHLFGLQAALRISLTSALPLAGGILLHAAGVASDERSAIFFGESGAGKSTLASHATCDVLSDELVAITPSDHGFASRATGFWGTMAGRAPFSRTVPLTALVQLDKGAGFAVTALTHDTALQGLIRTAMFYPVSSVAPHALAVLGRILRTVPAFRMEWNPETTSWEDIQHRILPCESRQAAAPRSSR